MDNLEIYKKMSEPPKTALKTIQGGKLKNFTDINPQWRYKAMTEVFGIVGIGWKYTIDKTWLETGSNGEVAAFAQVSVFVRDPETKEWSDAIVGVGGSKLVTKEKDYLVTNDEAFKMAVTDAFSTSLKMLGVAAGVYEGRWDGSKYSRPVETATTPSSPAKAVVTDPETKEAIETLESYIKDGKLNKDWVGKAQMYIDTANLEGIKKTIAYIEEQMKAEAAFDA